MPVVTAVVVSMLCQWLINYMPLRSRLATLHGLTPPQNSIILIQVIGLMMKGFGLDPWLFAALYSVHSCLSSRCLGNFLHWQPEGAPLHSDMGHTEFENFKVELHY